MICTKQPWNSDFFWWNRMRTSGSTTYFNLGQNLWWNRWKIARGGGKTEGSEEQKRKEGRRRRRPSVALSTRCRRVGYRQRAIGNPHTDGGAQRADSAVDRLPRELEPAVGFRPTDCALSVHGPTTGTYFSKFSKTAYIFRISGKKTYI